MTSVASYEELRTAAEIMHEPRSPRKADRKTYWTRLAACTSISSILYELSSSLIRCASAGVSLLHVAGSLRLSYTVAGKVSYTDRLAAKARRFEGAVAERCVSVGGLAENMVDSAGAEEFGWLKSVPFSFSFSFSEDDGPDADAGPAGASLVGDSKVSPFESNDNGGRKVAEFCGECPLADPCDLWSPSICAGSEGGR